jgi:hypothetical protein
LKSRTAKPVCAIIVAPFVAVEFWRHRDRQVTCQRPVGAVFLVSSE